MTRSLSYLFYLLSHVLKFNQERKRRGVPNNSRGHDHNHNRSLRCNIFLTLNHGLLDVLIVTRRHHTEMIQKVGINNNLHFRNQIPRICREYVVPFMENSRHSTDVLPPRFGTPQTRRRQSEYGEGGSTRGTHTRHTRRRGSPRT